MRQLMVADFDPKPGVSIASLSYEYAAKTHLPEHAHGSDQLIYAVSGVMEVSAGQKVWIIPPQFAIWIPAYTFHRIRMPAPVSMRTLYVRRGRQQSHDCAVLTVTPLLRELILETIRLKNLRGRNTLESSVAKLLMHELKRATTMSTVLRLPVDPRGVRIAHAYLAGIADNPRLNQLCSTAGVSVRTAERIFHSEVGTSFSVWKTQARLMKAIELLAQRRSVKEAAYAIGYTQPSAFIEAFRELLGVTPRQWSALHRHAAAGTGSTRIRG